jgi:hypothetical protein
MSAYLKRAVQGKFKDTSDGIGEQYSPQRSRAHINISINSNVTTESRVEGDGLDARSVAETRANEVTTRRGNEEIPTHVNERLFP